ncbi:MAG: hypothetical protein KA751_04490, partial [Comamonas sp.]|nr:hypothetical protein [Comamonas sp.]
MGGIIGPFLFAGLPYMLEHETSALSIAIVAVLIFFSTYLLKTFFRKTPAHLLASYEGTNEPAKEPAKQAEQNTQAQSPLGLDKAVTPAIIDAKPAEPKDVAVSVDGNALKKAELANRIKTKMNLYKDKIPADKKPAIEGALQKLKDAHKAGDIAAIDAATAELNNAWQA